MTSSPAGHPQCLTLLVKDTGLGGAEISLLHLLSYLKSRTWRTELVAHRKGRMFGLFSDATDRQLTVGFPYPRQPGSWFRLPSFYVQVRRQLNSCRSSILFSGDFYTLWAALFFRSPQRPVWSLWQGEYRFDDDSCVRKWLKYGATKADRLLASEPVARHANSTGLLPRSVEVLNPIADDKRFDPSKYDRHVLRRRIGWSECEHVALCVGRVGGGKGQAWLAEEFLRADFPKSAKLVIAGPGTDAALQAMARARPERLQLLGPRSDIPELLAAADLAIQPGSLSESFGLAALEAVLMCKPLLALKVGALHLTLGEDYPGLCGKDCRSELVGKWLSLSYGNNLFSSVVSDRDRLVARFGSEAWRARVERLFGLT